MYAASRFAVVLFAAVLVLPGCSKQSLASGKTCGTVVETWASLGRTPPPVHDVVPESFLPSGVFPWAGTVSHHLLADPLIDRWFAGLAARRNIKTFFILSPSHWGLSSQEWSLADCTWKVADGQVVRTDSKIEQHIAGRLGVSFEPVVFTQEHGISTLMPYIASYFPGSTVVAVAYAGEPPLNQRKAQKLADALFPYFTGNGVKNNFLLVSADFAHHGNLAGTEYKDLRTREFFKAPTKATWIFAGCDNRPGIYCISRFLQAGAHCTVLYHSNSFELSGCDGDDITSYFFTYFW